MPRLRVLRLRRCGRSSSRVQLEAGCEPVRRADPVEEAAEEVEVHAADKRSVLLGQPVERAVGECDLVVVAELRLVAVPRQHLEHRPAAVFTALER